MRMQKLQEEGEASWYLRWASLHPWFLDADAQCTSYTLNCKYQRCVQHLHIYISMCCISVLLVFVSAESNVGLIPREEAVRECGKYLGISFAGDVTHQRWILSRGTRDITRLYHFTCNHTRLNQQWCVSLYIPIYIKMQQRKNNMQWKLCKFCCIISHQWYAVGVYKTGRSDMHF